MCSVPAAGYSTGTFPLLSQTFLGTQKDCPDQTYSKKDLEHLLRRFAAGHLDCISLDNLPPREAVFHGKEVVNADLVEHCGFDVMVQVLYLAYFDLKSRLLNKQHESSCSGHGSAPEGEEEHSLDELLGTPDAMQKRQRRRRRHRRTRPAEMDNFASPVAKLVKSSAAVEIPMDREQLGRSVEEPPPLLDVRGEEDDEEDLFRESSPSILPRARARPKDVAEVKKVNEDVDRAANPIPAAKSREMLNHQSRSKMTYMDDSFDRLPSPAENEPGYKYSHAPVRSKDERKKLQGFACPDCEKFYAGENLSDEKMQELMQKCSRHRAKFAPSGALSPKEPWKMTIDSDDEKERTQVGGPPLRSRTTAKRNLLL